MSRVVVELVPMDDDAEQRRRRRQETRQVIGALLFVGALLALLPAKPADVIPPPQEPSPTAPVTVATPPPISVDPAAIDFGAMNVGTSNTLPITFKNPGSREFVTAAVASGLAPSDFSIAAEQCARIRPNGTCVATVSFAPRSAGPQKATFTLRSESNASLPVEVVGSGVALAGLLAFGQPEVALGAHRIGAASRQPFTITNGGNTSLTVTAIASSDPQFEASGCINEAIAAGGSCNGLIVFTPRSRGKVDATLTATDDTGKSATMTVNGAGVLHMLRATNPAVVIAPGQQTANGSVEFENSGDDDVAISATAIAPARVARIGNDECMKKQQLAPGEKCSIEVALFRDRVNATVTVTGDGTEAAATVQVQQKLRINPELLKTILRVQPRG